MSPFCHYISFRNKFAVKPVRHVSCVDTRCLFLVPAALAAAIRRSSRGGTSFWSRGGWTKPRATLKVWWVQLAHPQAVRSECGQKVSVLICGEVFKKTIFFLTTKNIQVCEFKQTSPLSLWRILLKFLACICSDLISACGIKAEMQDSPHRPPRASSIHETSYSAAVIIRLAANSHLGLQGLFLGAH